MNQTGRNSVTIIMWLSIFGLAALFGCAWQKTGEGKALETLPDEIKAETVIKITEMKEKIRAAHYTDWLLALFILAGAVGILTVIRGRPIDGLSVLGGSIGGIGITVFTQRAYEIPWYWIFGGLLVLLGFIAFLYRDIIGKGAFKNLVQGNGLTKAQSKIVEKIKPN